MAAVRRPYVAVVGGSNAGPDACRAAEEAARELARHGAIVVTGGCGGVMEAACRGAHEAGGTTLALLPGDDREAANPHVDVAVPTGMGEGRNVLVVRAADAVLAVGGEFGTLSEIAFALRLGKPVIGMATWQLSPPAAGGASDPIVRADDPREAARTALRLIGR